MKLTVLTHKDSSYTEFTKSLLIRLSREVDIDYEIVEINPGEEPMIARGKELPCFILNEKVVMAGRPSYEQLKKILSRKGGFLGFFKGR